MKLIATKKLSAQLQAGARFEQPDRQARMLIAAGVARADDGRDDTANEPQKSRRTYRRRDLVSET